MIRSRCLKSPPYRFLFNKSFKLTTMKTSMLRITGTLRVESTGGRGLSSLCVGWNYFSIPNFNGATVEVWECISYFIPHTMASNADNVSISWPQHGVGGGRRQRSDGSMAVLFMVPPGHIGALMCIISRISHVMTLDDIWEQTFRCALYFPYNIMVHGTY